MVNTSISTHAPRVRRDYFFIGIRVADSYFYSRASCEARLDDEEV